MSTKEPGKDLNKAGRLETIDAGTFYQPSVDFVRSDGNKKVATSVFKKSNVLSSETIDEISKPVSPTTRFSTQSHVNSVFTNSEIGGTIVSGRGGNKECVDTVTMQTAENETLADFQN
jgi:hypothetical protein